MIVPHDCAADWVAWMAPRYGLPSGPLESIDSDHATIQPAVDKVFRLPDGLGLVHIEVQSGWDDELPDRILLDNVLLHHRHQSPVHLFAILLRREANAPSLTGQLVRYGLQSQEMLRFQYQVVRVWEQSADQLLAGGLGTALLGLLTDDAEGRINELVHCLADRVEREVPDVGLRERILVGSDLLSGMRYDKDILRSVFMGIQHMRDSSTYQAILVGGRHERLLKGQVESRVEGRVEGIVDGLRLSLVTLLEQKFGSIPSAIQSRIDRCQDETLLRDAIRQVASLASADELTL